MKRTLKVLVVWVVTFALRLIPFRPANVESITSTVMPLSKKSAVAGVLFSMSAIVFYDAVTAGIGAWTWMIAGAYGLLAIASSAFFANRTGTRAEYVGFAVVSTIIFDIATGFTMGPLLFGQSFTGAVLGQIPFTIVHVASNILLAAVVSPALAAWFAADEEEATIPAPELV